MSDFKNDPSKLLRINQKDLQKIMKNTRELSWKRFGKRIRFYAPSFVQFKSSQFTASPNVFPSISITGSSCTLKCKHCQGKILKTMIPIFTPTELIDVCRSLKDKGNSGFLLSGGCLPDGSVPIEKYIETISQIKRDLGLTIVVHTGLINDRTAKKLRDAGVDAALIDVIGSNETINEVYQLNIRVEDYDKSLRTLSESGIPFVPHVLAGLHYGKLKGEFQSLKMISKYNPAAVIIIAFIPIKGTVMENVPPPTPEDISRVVIAAKILLPDTPVVLGCMRPRGKHRIKTDLLAVKSGVNAIAFPTEEAIKLAESFGVTTTFSPVCCSQIYSCY